MHDPTPPTRGDLLLEMRAGQERVVALVNDLGPENLARLHDVNGWTAKDHLAHLNAWERAFISWLEGRTRAEGLGIPETLWNTRDIDAINETVRARHAFDTLESILSELDRNRDRLKSLVASLPEVELSKPYSHFPGHEPAHQFPTVAHRVRRVVGGHVDEHLGYIRQMKGLRG